MSEACSSPFVSCGPHGVSLECAGCSAEAWASPPHSKGGKRLLIVAFAHFAPPGFELRARLVQLGFLLSRQNGKHLLIKLRTLAHQLRLERRDVPQLLISQSVV